MFKQSKMQQIDANVRNTDTVNTTLFAIQGDKVFLLRKDNDGHYTVGKQVDLLHFTEFHANILGFKLEPLEEVLEEE